MNVSSFSKKIYGLVFGLAVAIVTAGFIFASEVDSEDTIVEPTPILQKEDLAHLIGPFVQKNELPGSVTWPNGTHKEELELHYTIDEELQEHTDKMIRRFRPDYAALVAMDATTGEILTMSSYTHAGEERNLNLIATFPAASIFKMITAAAGIDTSKVDAETVIPFNGRSHTLFRRDIKNKTQNKWTRYITLREAFSRSVNTFFGKLGLYHVGAVDLAEYAERFLFNQKISADFPMTTSVTHIPVDDDWAVVEASSGYTKLTTLSPVHGALLAAAVANDGAMMEPYLVQTALDSKGDLLYRAVPTVTTTPIQEESSKQLKVLMQETVARGTSRKPFRRLLRHHLYSGAEFGGKTGSLTGNDPFGRTDWFVGYMEYKDKKIALAVVSVHEKIWRVKSSQLASSYFEEYLYRMVTEEAKMAQSEAKNDSESDL